MDHSNCFWTKLSFNKFSSRTLFKVLSLFAGSFHSVLSLDFSNQTSLIFIKMKSSMVIWLSLLSFCWRFLKVDEKLRIKKNDFVRKQFEDNFDDDFLGGFCGIIILMKNFQAYSGWLKLYRYNYYWTKFFRSIKTFSRHFFINGFKVKLSKISNNVIFLHIKCNFIKITNFPLRYLDDYWKCNNTS